MSLALLASFHRFSLQLSAYDHFRFSNISISSFCSDEARFDQSLDSQFAIFTKMSLTNLHVTKHSIQGQHVREYARDVATPGRDSSIQIKQYTPKARQDPQASGITVIAAGGLGFIKVMCHRSFDVCAMAQDLQFAGSV